MKRLSFGLLTLFSVAAFAQISNWPPAPPHTVPSGSAGAVPYYINASTLGVTGVGTSGQFLKSNGTSSPSWANAPSAVPAGSPGFVQFNNSGSFGGTSIAQINDTSGGGGGNIDFAVKDPTSHAGAFPSAAAIMLGVSGDSNNGSQFDVYDTQSGTPVQLFEVSGIGSTNAITFGLPLTLQSNDINGAGNLLFASDGGQDIGDNTHGANHVTSYVLRTREVDIFDDFTAFTWGKISEDYTLPDTSTVDVVVQGGPSGSNTTAQTYGLAVGTSQTSTSSKPVLIFTADAPASSNGSSGSIVVHPGLKDGTGARGKIKFKDGSEGTSGQCWISSDTGGSGHWATCPGGGGGLPEYHAGSAVSSDGSCASNSFATCANSPTLTFTAGVSGDFEVVMAPPIQSAGCYIQIAATSGSPTQLENQQGSQISTSDTNTTYVRSVFTLESGNSYSFDLQGKSDGGGSTPCTLRGTAASSNIWARQVR